VNSIMGADKRDTAIWDIPTRLFHWSLVILVGSNLFLVGPRGGWETMVHFISGFAIAGLLLFRLIWGFIGSPRSRFADFLKSWRTVKAYAARLARLDPPHSIGHNPLGGWMIGVMLATLLGMVGTGLFAASRRAAGPFCLVDLQPGRAPDWPGPQADFKPDDRSCCSSPRRRLRRLVADPR
jgi:cytochrome b